MPNRNTEQKFSLNPTIGIDRSRFEMTPDSKCTFNLGDLVPLFAPIEVLPGDTFEISLSMVLRMQSLKVAPFDSLHFDYYYFYCPSRILWSHYREFFGENTSSAWIPTTQYTIPTLNFLGGVAPKSVGDYFGLPTNMTARDPNPKLEVSALPFRAFAMIYNEWFRDTNVMNPVHIDLDDTNRTGINDPTNPNWDNYVNGLQLGGKLPKVCKVRDYFTSCLPGPQRSADIDLFTADFPIYFGTGRSVSDVTGDHALTPSRLAYGTGTNDYGSASWSVGGSNRTNMQPTNWYADVTPLTISQLRTAFQIQKLYEKEARSGDRFVSLLKGHFNVTPSDASLQRPQYLGGKRVPININQILQTSETNTTPQGNVAGYSLTGASSGKADFIRSFDEPGYLIVCGCARRDEIGYQQGVRKMWTRKNKLDFYFPVLANISEQPVYKNEIYCTNTDSKSVFGYQEPWADYRYTPSQICAELRSDYAQSLDSWHFADDYSSSPTLSRAWIQEDETSIDRSLTVASSVSDQFFGDFLFDIKATRPMPMFSIPGLVDHH